MRSTYHVLLLPGFQFYLTELCLEMPLPHEVGRVILRGALGDIPAKTWANIAFKMKWNAIP